MQKYTKEQLETQYKKLPDALKDALFSVEIANKIYEIGRKFGLTIEKTGFMAEETGYVVLGLTQPQDFTQFLVERLEVKIDEAKEIASAINQQIFYPLREALKTTHQIEVNEETIQKNFIILKKSVPPQATTTPAPPIIPRPAPKTGSEISTVPVKSPEATAEILLPGKPPEPLPLPAKPALSSAPQSSLSPPSLKPLAEKTATPIPAPPFKSSAEKTALLLSPLPATPKVEPIDLRFQQKTKFPAPPPRSESMGGSIFGAPSIVNLAPKPPLPPQPQIEKPPRPKPIPNYDPYKEPIE